jgi:hypothetical protein
MSQESRIKDAASELLDEVEFNKGWMLDGIPVTHITVQEFVRKYVIMRGETDLMSYEAGRAIMAEIRRQS